MRTAEPMTTKHSEPKRRSGGRSARVVSAVLEATRTELHRVGYGALSVERVAELAGVAKTTVYRRWPKKSQLVRAALLERIEARMIIPEDAGSLEVELGVLAKDAYDNLQSPDGRGRLRVLYGEGNNPEVRSLVRTIRKAKLRVPRELFQRAVARGEIVNAEVGDLAWQMILGALHLRVCLLGERLTVSELQQLARVALSGVRAEARRQEGLPPRALRS